MIFIHNIREDNIPLWSLPSPSSASNVDLKEVALAHARIGEKARRIWEKVLSFTILITFKTGVE